MTPPTDRELDLMQNEIVDLRSLYRAIGADLDGLKSRFNLVIVSSCLLTVIAGGARILDCLGLVF